MYSRYLKRILEFFFCAFLLILFSPICLLVIIAIKMDTKGPIFADVPQRVGRNGKLFKMYKFRSMIVNAHYMLRENAEFKKLFEEYKKGSYKLRNDPRITKVGKFIRKYSLDEVPQFINVIKGDMSLVGPRAYYPDELEAQQKKYPHTESLVKEVLSVNPGITGLWQVSGRSDINFDKRIALDAKYVHNISLLGDLKIIIKTPLAMLTGKGAV